MLRGPGQGGRACRVPPRTLGRCHPGSEGCSQAPVGSVHPEERSPERPHVLPPRRSHDADGHPGCTPRTATVGHTCESTQHRHSWWLPRGRSPQTTGLGAGCGGQQGPEAPGWGHSRFLSGRPPPAGAAHATRSRQPASGASASRTAGAPHGGSERAPPAAPYTHLPCVPPAPSLQVSARALTPPVGRGRHPAPRPRPQGAVCSQQAPGASCECN